mmetsp:Transcript_13646/g.28920  ORF Transcript_13646/g.28920 Transcript_13646/m.28920 type:complete len:193 (-) Transcript_13646:222-800(-)
MKQLGLPPSVQHTPLDGLSGGEKARLCICQMLLSRATLLVCDEPTNHLDLLARAYLQEALKQFDGALVLASHDRYFASGLGTKVLSIEPGATPEDPTVVELIDGDWAAYETHLRAQEAAPAAFLPHDAERDEIHSTELGHRRGKGEEETDVPLTVRERRKKRVAARAPQTTSEKPRRKIRKAAKPSARSRLA